MPPVFRLAFVMSSQRIIAILVNKAFIPKELLHVVTVPDPDVAEHGCSSYQKSDFGENAAKVTRQKKGAATGALIHGWVWRQFNALSVIAWVQAASPGSEVMTGSEPPERSDSTVRWKSAGSSAPFDPAVSFAISPIMRF